MASANSFAIVLKAMVVGDANLTLTSVNLIPANTEVHVGTPLITTLVRAPKVTVDEIASSMLTIALPHLVDMEVHA